MRNSKNAWTLKWEFFSCGVLCLTMVCACSRPVEPPAPGESDETARTVDEVELLQTYASQGDTAAQRELAGRLLFGQGVDQDIPAALEWAEKAARGGEAVAAIWMGRKFLSQDPPALVPAAAWFLIAIESADPAAAQDARGELEAFALNEEEQRGAKALADELKKSFLAPGAGDSE